MSDKSEFDAALEAQRDQKPAAEAAPDLGFVRSVTDRLKGEKLDEHALLDILEVASNPDGFNNSVSEATLLLSLETLNFPSEDAIDTALRLRRRAEKWEGTGITPEQAHRLAMALETYAIKKDPRAKQAAETML